MAQPMPRKSGRQTVEPDRLSPSELGGEIQYGKNRALTVTNDPDPNTQEPAHKFKARETSASSYSPSRELGLSGEVCSVRPFRQPCFKKEEQQEEGKAEETQKEVACAGGGAEEEAGGATLVGARVEVYWTGDCKWFAGVVDRYDAAHGYRISYADGDVKWHELDQPDEKWRVLAPAPSPAHVMPLIHSRVRVWWTGRWGGWYAGRVVSVRRSPSGGSLHQVVYDDGETKTHDLRVEIWKVLDDDDDDNDDDDDDDDDLIRLDLITIDLPDELCDELWDRYLQMIMPAIDSPRASSSPSSCGQRDEDEDEDGDAADVESGYGDESYEDEAEETNRTLTLALALTLTLALTPTLTRTRLRCCCPHRCLALSPRRAKSRRGCSFGRPWR